jgi:hypothetical protein
MKDKLWEHMHNEHDLLLLESEIADIKEICKSEIKWEDLKEAFYNECVTEDPPWIKNTTRGPLFVFNWFKNEINEYLK